MEIFLMILTFVPVLDLFPLKLAAGPRVSAIIRDSSRLNLTKYVQVLEEEACERHPDRHVHVLGIALSRGQIGLVEALLTASSDTYVQVYPVNLYSPFSWNPWVPVGWIPLSPLDIVAEIGQDTTLKYLLERFDYLDCGYLRTRAFRHAAVAGHSSTVKLLLDTGVDNPLDAVLEAIRRGHTEIVRLLLGYGVQHHEHEKVMQRIICDRYALEVAVTYGEAEMVRLLLDYGAPRRVHPWWDAFHIAVSRGHLEIVSLLVNYMTDVDNVPDCILPALHLALHKKDMGPTSTLLQQKSAIGYLRRFGKTVLVNAIKSALKSMTGYITGRQGHTDIEEKIEIWACQQHRPVTYHLDWNKQLILGTSSTWIQLKLYQK
jgi:ankyrin repeat protein